MEYKPKKKKKRDCVPTAPEFFVDDKPLPMNPIQLLDSHRLTGDFARYREIATQNKKLLKRINTINNTIGAVDSYNPKAYFRMSRWRGHEIKMKKIVKENKYIHCRINSVESQYDAKKLDKQWKKNYEAIRASCKLPFALQMPESLDSRIKRAPSISSISEKVTRPKCFMDFRVKDGVYLGRIVIELYHDYAPVTVQNFMSICSKKDGLTYKNCNVHRIIPGKCIVTGDITLGSGKGGTSIYGETFDEENHVLRHARMGVLSMVPVKPNCNNSIFSISLQELKEFDGVRVVFGKVIKGHETLCKLGDLGRKHGTPRPPILILDCGKFIKGKTPSVIRNYKFK